MAAKDSQIRGKISPLGSTAIGGKIPICCDTEETSSKADITRSIARPPPAWPLFGPRSRWPIDQSKFLQGLLLKRCRVRTSTQCLCINERERGTLGTFHTGLCNRFGGDMKPRDNCDSLFHKKPSEKQEGKVRLTKANG